MPNSKRTRTDVARNAGTISAATLACSPVAAKDWFEVMTACSEFVMNRLHQDLETQKAILACKTPADLLGIQTDYYQQATRQYSQQATRMFEMMASSAQKTLTEAGSSHARKYDDIPL